jgi:hypothetical protein
MTILRMNPSVLKVNNVVMMGREYDFTYHIDDRQMYYRESNHLGGKFAPISDSSRYSKEVRKVVREVGLAFFCHK